LARLFLVLRALGAKYQYGVMDDNHPTSLSGVAQWLSDRVAVLVCWLVNRFKKQQVFD